MATKEIVTLQLGHYANYVGAHLWNIQESTFVYHGNKSSSKKEICNDILYREGENRRREVTYTPRLIAFDLKGSLRTLKQEGSLYDPGTEGEEIQWPGDVTMHKEAIGGKLSFLQSLETHDVPMEDEDDDGDRIISKDFEDDEESISKKKSKKKRTEDSSTAKLDDVAQAKLYNLDDRVSVWSDFLGTNFHAKSLHIVEEFRHQNDLHPFDLYTCGQEVLSNYEHTCEWEDRIHYFTEECDNLQGFHVLMDTHNGFGGLSTGVLKYLEEEFPGKGILSFGFTPADAPDHTALARATRIINSALSYESASTHSSLFVPASVAKGLWNILGPPVTFPNLTFSTKAYHTSSILASVLDTVSLPYRLDSGGMDIRDITHSFNAQARKLASVNASLPLGLFQDESLIDLVSMYSQTGQSNPWQPLTPHTTGEGVPLMQSVVSRGILDSQVKSNTDPRKLPRHLVGCQTRFELLSNFLTQKFVGNVFSLNCLESPLKTTIPFPHIFKDNLNKAGYMTRVKRADDVGVESVPVMTSLQSSPELKGVVEQLHGAAAKMNIKKHHRYLAGGIEEDDYVEVLDNLQSLANNYKTDVEAL